jgi:hypothetical protein
MVSEVELEARQPLILAAFQRVAHLALVTNQCKTILSHHCDEWHTQDTLQNDVTTWVKLY